MKLQKEVKSTQQQLFKLAAESGSPTQDGQSEKVVKFKWQQRNVCDGRSTAKIFNINNSGEFCADS